MMCEADIYILRIVQSVKTKAFPFIWKVFCVDGVLMNEKF
jgi:hypothetical protein